MGKLVIKKEHIGSEVSFQYNGDSRTVKLSEDTPQEQLKMIQFVGVDIFEKEEKATKEK